MKLGSVSRGLFRLDYGEAPGLAARIVDGALIGTSVAIAVGSVLFAGVMLTTDRPPGVNGVQYLAIFAQPKAALKAGQSAPGETLDMSPLGAIDASGGRHGSDFSFVGAAPGFAWLREGERVFSVRTGDKVPGLGDVRDIRRVEGRWIILGPGDSELLSSATAPTLVDLPPKAPSGHKLVLGGQP